MNQKNNYSYHEVDVNIKASQKMIWFSIGLMVGIGMSMAITGALIYLID